MVRDSPPRQDRRRERYDRRDDAEPRDRPRDGYESRRRDERGRESRDGPRGGDRSDRDRDNYRDRDGYRDRDRDRGYGRARDDERRREDGRDDRRRDGGRDGRREPQRRSRERGQGAYGDRAPGPSRRSASPRSRASQAPQAREDEEPEEDKTKPNFAPSGLLAAETKKVTHGDGTSTVLKYHEPPEARKPVVGWRLYVFKGKEQVELLHIQRQSAYLFGRDRAVVDVFVEHPSCSKQHAVIQYRQVHEKNEFGDAKPVVKPYIIDLESTNGTTVNDEAVPTSKYYELRLGDVIKFGESTREYVLLSEDAA